MGKMWNLWHGCHKYSEGCAHCYVYRSDAKYERDASKITKTLSFDLPVQKNKKGEYKNKAGTFFYTCFTSDFLIEDCDNWRKEAWLMIRERNDCTFLFITKRIDRFIKCVPDDWGSGWDNVIVCVTTENQKQADYRLPIFKQLPIKNKGIILEPLLEKVNISKYLDNSIKQVVAGGESGKNARPCDYNWILNLRDQCKSANINFNFKQTGTYFIKDGKQYTIDRWNQHSQARQANINFIGGGENFLNK